MNRHQYQQARRLIRENGRIAYRWIANQHGQTLADRLRALSETEDWLAMRMHLAQHSKQKGWLCTAKQTRPNREYREGRWIGAAGRFGVAGNIHKSI